MLYLTEYQWICTALGWSIIHSVWQIALIGVVWFFISSIANEANSSTKYFIAKWAMIAIMLVPLLTLFTEMKSHCPIESQIFSDSKLPQIMKPVIGEVPSESDQNDLIPAFDEPAVFSASKNQFTAWLSHFILKSIVIIWLGGVLFFGLRFMLQWLGMQRLARKGVFPFEEEQLTAFNKLKNNLGIKKSISFLQSALVASPMTFGHFKPIILLPLGMINGFPPAQIEAIILHELAHIQRNDFLINAIQTWLEILFFYHPVVWIISKRIKTFREELCDDEVIRMMSGRSRITHKNEANRINKGYEEGSKQNSASNITDHKTADAILLYAESLLNLQKYFLHNKNQLAMNAKGNKGELSHRIHRLFQPTQTITNEKRNINTYLLGLVMLIAVVSFAFSKISYPTVSIAVDKMNVLYIGIDNPITVAVAGVPTEKTKVESEQLIIKDQGNGHYIVKASEEGKVKIKVTAEGHASKEAEFRVKRIPDPIARIFNSSGGKIDAERMIKSEGIDAILDYFEFDAECAITSFTMTWVAKNEDPIESINRSGQYSEKTKELLQKAKTGDIYYFDNVKCRCLGDESERAINSMVFKIR